MTYMNEINLAAQTIYRRPKTKWQLQAVGPMKKNDIMDLLASIRIPIQPYQNNYRSNPQVIHGALTHTKKKED